MEIKLELVQDSFNTKQTESIVLPKGGYRDETPYLFITLPDGREIAVDLKDCLNAIKLLSED